MDEGNQIPLWLCDFPHNFPINSAIKRQRRTSRLSQEEPSKTPRSLNAKDLLKIKGPFKHDYFFFASVLPCKRMLDIYLIIVCDTPRCFFSQRLASEALCF